MGKIDLRELKRLDKFQASSGVKYQRYAGFRDAVVPRWRKMFKSVSSVPRNKTEKARKVVKRVQQLVEQHGGCVRDVLEIGCSGGAYTFALAELGARRIDALDTKLPSAKLLHHVGQRYEGTECEINFYDADIAGWKKKDAYDLVITRQTMEHIIEWEKAVEVMYDALRSGGLCYHEYQPFFGWKGGHSLCTLDFPYGHVLLSASDFERYIKTYRPKEYKRAMDYYYNGLNRMTWTDLRHCVDKVGFETLILSRKPKNGGLFFTHAMLTECKANYPTLTMEDLVANTVQVLLRKS